MEPSDLTDVLKALDHQVVKSDDPIPKDNHFVWLISGAKGTGKSSLLLNVLRTFLRKQYNNIFLISPTAKRDKKFKMLVDELEDDNKYYDALSEANLNEIMERITEYNANTKKAKPHNLLILDDVATDLRSSGSKSLLNKIIITCRHMKTSVVILTQKYNKVNPLIRSNADILSIFRTQNKKELNTIIDDLPVKPDEFQVVYDYATTPDDQNANPFLHVKLSGSRTDYYKNFDRLHIKQ